MSLPPPPPDPARTPARPWARAVLLAALLLTVPACAGGTGGTSAGSPAARAGTATTPGAAGGAATARPEAPARTPSPRRTPEAAPETTPAAARDVRALLARVRVVPRRPDVPGYDRDCGPGDGCVFGTEWSDDTSAPQGRDGCDTRNDVLARDLRGVRFSDTSPECDVVAGRLRDPYTGVRMDYATESSRIHVDHLFPLAAAWDLGAARWTPARRARFANDVDVELLAVSATANLSKGDGTPADWLPPREAFRCEYVQRYLRVATTYRLAITRADRRVVRAVARTDC
ncbi:HNH endonuclease family protein [Nocardioides sp.]|uniref:HNH endonuclease family protein n=1 Tax=Nocardioides sp. TaxID=35761 RepID=UPI0035167888